MGQGGSLIPSAEHAFDFQYGRIKRGTINHEMLAVACRFLDLDKHKK